MIIVEQHFRDASMWLKIVTLALDKLYTRIIRLLNVNLHFGAVQHLLIQI